MGRLENNILSKSNEKWQTAKVRGIPCDSVKTGWAKESDTGLRRKGIHGGNERIRKKSDEGLS